jgi:cytochrome c oxidase assembly factor CtaG
MPSAKPPVDASWTFAPIVLIAIALYACVYVARWRRTRAEGDGTGATGLHLVLFSGGLVALLLALASPVERLADQMFIWHTIQHILLLDAAPILLVLGLSEGLLRPVLGRLRAIERAAGLLARPAGAVVVYAGTLGAWHIPPLYDLALTNGAVHALQHVMLLAAGALFWWHVLGAVRPRRAARGLGVFLFMGTAKGLTGILASILTFAPQSGFFYGPYEAQPRLWHLTVYGDHQIGGGLLMIEEVCLMTAAFGFMFLRMLDQSSDDDEAEEAAVDRGAAPGPTPHPS